MIYTSGNDFRYSGFWVSRYWLQDQIADIKASAGWLGYSRRFRGIIESIISSIASDDFDVKPGDNKVFELVEDLIRRGGYTSNGVYTEEAHAAMRNLCIRAGKNPDNYILYDKTISGRFQAAKSKLKGVFGSNKKTSHSKPVPQQSASKPAIQERPQPDSNPQPKPQPVSEPKPQPVVPEQPKPVVPEQPKPAVQQPISKPKPKPQPKQEKTVETFGLTAQIAQNWRGFKRQLLSHIMPKPKPVQQPAPQPVVPEQPKPASQHSASKPQSKKDTSKEAFGLKARIVQNWRGFKRRINPVHARLAATVISVGALAVGTYWLSNNIDTINSIEGSSGNTPTFKEVSVPSVSHQAVQVHDISDSLQNGFAFGSDAPSIIKLTDGQAVKPIVQIAPIAPTAPQATNSVSRQAQVATDSVSVQLTRTSKSALNILLGEKKADELCGQVQHQIDAGIFAAPQGMSVERIAHAMTMSRVYEGRSVILDALNSDVALTPDQQAAFNQHIDDIGDLGVKLQKRMASKHKLSKHSRFDRASKSQQKVHIKNLKQLKQFRQQLARGR